MAREATLHADEKDLAWSDAIEDLEELVMQRLEQTGLSRQGLAARVGCTIDVLDRKLGGKVEMSIWEARRLAVALGVDAEDVFRLAP